MNEEEILKTNLDHTASKMTKEIWPMIFKNKGAFATYDQVGDCNLTVSLKLKDESPFFIRPYPVSEVEKGVIDRE